MSTLSCAGALESASEGADSRIALDARRFSTVDLTASASPCQLIDGRTPSCAEQLALPQTIERFRREALWDTCDTGRYRCRFSVWGEGPPLVIIPGMCDDPWSYVLPMARLSATFCCVAYHLPAGAGDGARLVGYRHDHLVDDLFALLDHLKMDHACLLGSSFGCTVALVALQRRPERFPRGVLQGAFARRPLAWAEVMLASWARWWPWSLDHLPLRGELFRHAHEPLFVRRDPDLMRYHLEMDGRQRIAAVAHRALLLRQLDLRPLLPAIRQPILILSGDRDPMIGRECVDELMSGLPNASRAEIEGCGHLPHFTHPEVMSEVVQRFLSH
ncbi:MAG: alpha/beta hydrolase [Gemmataceae bacterium]|nr:alpha/beta hydrolase [Gemmataceae bacterium]